MFLLIEVDYGLHQDEDPLRIIDHGNHYIVSNARSSIVARIRKRSAFPRTFCRQLANGDFELGYDQEPESLNITVTRTGTITVTRDAYATLPVFFGWSNDTLVISNLYEEVASRLPKVHLSYPDFLASMAPRSLSAHTTILKEIRLLAEREVLVANKEGVRVQIPPSRPWTISSEAPPTDSKGFLSFFDEHLRRFVATRFLDDNFAFQASGGLDSATLPIFTARHYAARKPPILTGILPPGDDGTSQLLKLEALARATQYPLVVEPVDPAIDFPLARFSHPNHPRLFYYRDGFNLEPIERNADELQRRGITVLATGIGGDDVCENFLDIQSRIGYGPNERVERKAYAPAPYFTDKFRQDYIATTPPSSPYALPYMAVSTQRGIVVANNRCIERDIWPVSPFIDPAVYTYIQGLPAHFRYNKNILRAFHYALGSPQEVYASGKQEDFAEFMRYGMMHQPAVRSFIMEALDYSIAVREGYIDPVVLHKVYDEQKSDTGIAIALYRWLCIEMSLRHTSNLKNIR